jgi:hypothetical protein
MAPKLLSRRIVHAVPLNRLFPYRAYKEILMRRKNFGHFFAAIAKQRPYAFGGVNMVQRVVFVPFSSMRSIINAAERPISEVERPAGALPSSLLPDSVPQLRYSAMPEQDLTVWSASLLFEALIRAGRSLLRPTELRLAHVRKRDRA